MTRPVFLFLFLCISVAGFADESLPLSLRQVLQMASERDIRLILSQERVAQALARIEQSRSVLLPQVSLNASQHRMTRDLRSSGITLPGDPLVGPFNTFDARAQLTQTLFDSSAMMRLKVAQAGKQLSLTELRKTKEDVLALMATLYINARRAQESLEYAKTIKAREEKRMRIMQLRSKDGAASLLDVQQVQALYNQALSLWQNTANKATNTRLDLLAALGLDLEQAVIFNQEDEISFPDPTEEADTHNSPQLQTAEEELSLNQMNRSVEKSDFFPKISALADYGPSGLTPSDTNNTYTLGVQASWPIFDGGLRRSRVKEKESEVKSAEAILMDTKRKVKADSMKARIAFEQAEIVLKERISQRDVSQHQLRLAQQRFQDGIGSDVEVLEAQAQDATISEQESEARAQLLLAQIEWAHTLGKIDHLLSDVSKVRSLNE
jgi:outer membrane protein TolC